MRDVSETIRKDEGPANDEVGSFTVAAPSEGFGLWGWGGGTEASWPLRHMHAIRLFLASPSNVCHVKTSAAVPVALLREVE